MQIGPYTIHFLTTCEFALDGGAMFGIIPKPLWEKQIGVDARNRIDMTTRLLLLTGTINHRTHHILIDTGMGDHWSGKERDIYRLSHARYSLASALDTVGLSPEQITDVILTHLHFDHAGGAVTGRNGQWSPTFPHATYYVQRAHLEWAGEPTRKDRGSFRPHDFEPLVTARQLTTLDGPTELFPGIGLRLTQGHTTALQHPLITDGETTLFFTADLFPTSVHVPLPWIMAYDIRPLITVEEKETILQEAVRDEWILAFPHSPHHAAGTVIQTERGFQFGTPIPC
ncbi:MAG: MBL fold metallo-hydrolase [Deltaproteobacteria bacterium]|nr:MBL fold metallo-hydrolase [Deltaproteobacteria bacterium]